MNSRTFSTLQKTYDQAHLKSCTAAYHETLCNAPDALTTWRETLTLLTNSRLAPSYRPRNDAEATLITSLSDLESRARSRIAAIEAFLSGKPFIPPPPPPPRKSAPPVPPRPSLSTTTTIELDRLRRPTGTPTSETPTEGRLISPLQSPTDQKRSISYPILPAPRHGLNPPASTPLQQTTLKTTLRPNKPKKSYFPSFSSSTDKIATPPAALAATKAWGNRTPQRQVSSQSVPVVPAAPALQPSPRSPRLPNVPTPPAPSPRMKSKLGTAEISSSSSEHLPKRQVNPSMGTEVELPSAALAKGRDVASLILRFFEDSRKKRVRAQIEFIPPEFAPQPVLIEGNHIGITKKALVAAFIATKGDLGLCAKLREGTLSLEEGLRLHGASTIAILVDCEHLSAINARKRLVKTWPSVFRPDEEAGWLDGVLTSELRKHVKSSLLWGYRRWLMEEEGLSDFTIQWWRDEFGIIKSAGEVHRTNYYSWNYARWALQRVWILLDQETLMVEFMALTEVMEAWCRGHVSDSSGWSFLGFVYSMGLSMLWEKEEARRWIIEQVKEVMSYGHDVAPGHEALWVFVRSVLTPGFLETGGGMEEETRVQREGLAELLEKWEAETPVKERHAGPKKVGRVEHANGTGLVAALDTLHLDSPPPTIPPPLNSDSRSEWEERVKTALENLPPSIDPAAAQSILNEVVLTHDEVHWSDIAGLDGAKAALKEVVVYPFLRPDLFSGLREPARGMLLFGPPGTGKTMLARAVATESKSTFFGIGAGSLGSKWLGESEKLVRALFAMAKELAPSIIFIDEIDALLSSRSSGEHETNRKIKTEFLVGWSDLARAAAGKEKTTGDPSRVLVLGATNLPWDIDDAARRRFVRRQYIPLPEADTRLTHLKTLLAHQKTSLTDSEFDELVELTDGFSGSDITALAKDAAMGPLRSLGEGLLDTKMEDIRPIGMCDFRESLRVIRPSVGKEGLGRFEEWAKEFGERV
ncbi:AAA-domain-containing protein [Ascobolus immersus RN42]|uniref:AAA-domain-containing protein n=1 Tax=Ascobolus immersus RN42 TaxID=1160509 RepID=A0A3N4HRZ7_ASCIM|nr:AAA-domain-containing protein [Ascobolus immersus RN42]